MSVYYVSKREIVHNYFIAPLIRLPLFVTSFSDSFGVFILVLFFFFEVEFIYLPLLVVAYVPFVVFLFVAYVSIFVFAL